MAENRGGGGKPSADDSARAAAKEEETLRQRWDDTQESLRVRFDQPISRATRLTRATMAWFPVRVWRHFLLHNGFLLAAGVSYQALFASFAAIYVAFAIAGLWLGGSEQAVAWLIGLINSYIPGLIADSGGIATPEQVQEIASQNSGVLGWTGVIALGTLIWTAIGFVTYARRAVRDIFGLPPDRRSYFLLKARDLLAAAIFGLALVLGAALGSIGTWALNTMASLLGLDLASGWINASVRTGSILVGFAITSAALAALFRFLSGAQLAWRRIWPGAMVGGIGISVLQLGAGLLLSYTPSNPLLATFAIFIGLLLWFRLIGIVMLVAAAWIAVAANDRNVALLPQTEAERVAAEHAALLLAAQVRLRTAEQAKAHAPWFRVWLADRAVREAEEELREVEASAPPSPQKSSILQ
ncbi:YihY/virulence factor BrkB family protein [Microbacterium deminutum]|uniref:YihY/virulence factor BrkB family protein n=1 Tax=Microbacterium deminutum TaxID=344164 RepID=A0ABN2Q6M4_9MICO